MNVCMKCVSRTSLLVASLLAGTGILAAADDAGTPTATISKSSTQSDEIARLRATMAEQQKQLQLMQETLRNQQALLEKALVAKTSTFTGLGQVASTSPVIPVAPLPAIALPSPVAMQKEDAGRTPASDASPLQLKVGEATITPVGFMDLTNTYRSTNAGTSLQTNFGSIPYNNTVAGRLSEDKLSVANSRIGFRVDAKVKGANILGYYEGDFVGGVGNGSLNTQVSSNSLLYRVRLYWIDVRKDKLEFLAGQSWSMLTPNRKQISALPADLFYSQVVDVNYMNGLTWGRIPGIRALYHPSEKVTFGLSLENATQYAGGSGGGAVPTLPAALATPIAGEIDAGNVNGVATPNVHPDIIAKIAFDPSSRFHFEIAGVESTVKLFNPLTQLYFTKAGAGGSINANLELMKGLRVVTNNFWSDGEGRYLFGVVPDFIVRASGSPSLVHAGSTVSGLEFTHKNTQVYSYYGGIYAGRNTALDANGTSKIGYGYAGSPNSQNKTTQEGTIGLTQTLWKDGKYGALQMMVQYAWFFRNPWSVSAGAPKNAHENAAWFNLRYTLPGTAPTIKY
jgi:hypothetical protein